LLVYSFLIPYSLVGKQKSDAIIPILYCYAAVPVQTYPEEYSSWIDYLSRPETKKNLYFGITRSTDGLIEMRDHTNEILSRNLQSQLLFDGEFAKAVIQIFAIKCKDLFDMEQGEAFLTVRIYY